MQHFILAMGRMGLEKGLDLLLHAFALCVPIYPDWTLRLIGEGTEHPEGSLAIGLVGRLDRVKDHGSSSELQQSSRKAGPTLHLCALAAVLTTTCASCVS